MVSSNFVLELTENMATDSILEELLQEQAVVEEVIEDVDLKSKIIVHNDNVNTFDWVIQSLVEICRHSLVQAEQCAMLIHFKGQYAVKHGSRPQLKPMKEALIDRGINATLEP